MAESREELDSAWPNCIVCNGEGWVCEDHPLNQWYGGAGCCGSVGAPCECNPLSAQDVDLNIKTE